MSASRVQELFEREAAAHDDELESLLHLYVLNRGVLMTPFHNMALMGPRTTEEQVDLHTTVFSEALEEIHGESGPWNKLR